MSEPRERPILFSGPMVRALLEGRKTQTRRVVRGQKPLAPGATHFRLGVLTGWAANDSAVREEGARVLPCPFGVPGDRLWVRETWCFAHPEYHDQAEGVRRGDRPVRDEMPWWCHYAATDDDVDEPKWSPSIHMPRWASRLTLRVTSVRVERVQDISEEGAIAEGTGQLYAIAQGTAVQNFAMLWDSINGKRPGAAWRDNPFVWAVGFEVERRAP